MKHYIIGGVSVIAVLGALFLGLNTYIHQDTPVPIVSSHKDAEYRIEGVPVRLMNGVSEIAAGPDTSASIVTRYFGNELLLDLNDDGRQDVVFLLTQEQGGSGTFYYAVAALNLEAGYVGSDGYLLGDRIAPQSTVMSPNPRHKNVVVINYADRALDEPMSASPSIGKSAYLKLDVQSMLWGIVEPNFEGESW